MGDVPDFLSGFYFFFITRNVNKDIDCVPTTKVVSRDSNI